MEKNSGENIWESSKSHTLSYLDMNGTEEKDNCRSAELIGEEKN